MANVAAAPSAGHLGLRAGRVHEAASSASTALADLPSDHSYLDIPAFLRRQAD
jgi:cell division protein FtsZ